MKKSNTLNKIIFTVLSFFFILVILWILNNISIMSLGRLSKGINQQSIASIKLGMNQHEILERLGLPFNINKSYIVSPEGLIEPNSIYTIYEYSKLGILWNIEVNVVFDSENKLINVNMQEADGDFFIYSDKFPNKKIINLEFYNKIIPKGG